MPAKNARESRAVKAAMVLTPDANHHGTMFGGKVMAYIDDIAALSAARHARMPVVTASTDSVDFLHPVQLGQSVCLEAVVTWTHKTSIEVFVKVVAEDLLTGARNVCTTAFLTFVAVDGEGRPQPVPAVVPETELERFLHAGAPARAEARRGRRDLSRQLASRFGTTPLWQQ
ncbi:MAG: acyl-CoA thioesterase [Desulfuromonadales bacterium GWD2_61_12]|nr:MAG: acyl-CoA thioesterase [Desulfuromonadales bacterium GWC2_61_20]OGR33965.1 MAG: acyl-CoA thioesterase [Desulfuromonadales bacterium GWD2_61_12]HBT83173.1 acyl-CoA thioesterase [Desulfuromonas sp.]